jgi:hypothetical protein
MTKRPVKTKAAKSRPVEARRSSNTLRNRAVIASVLLAALGIAVWHPWAADRPQSRAVAAATPPVVKTPLPPVKPPAEPIPTLAAAPVATPAQSLSYTTASMTFTPAAPPLPPTPPAPSRMPPTLEADFDAWLIDAYRACYTPPSATPDGDPYLPRVRVALKADGTLAGAPRLVNPPWDPAWRPHADAAVKAVKSCDPLHVPDKYAPYYSQWKTKTVFFDPTRS